MWPILFFACATKTGPEAPPAEAIAWMDLGMDAPRLCLSPVEVAPGLGKSERQELAAARARVAAGETLALDELPEHPARKVVAGALLVQQGQDEAARELFRDLANVYEADPCVQEAAAITAIRAGQPEYARPYLSAALALWPQDVDVLLIDSLLAGLSGDSELVLGRLRQLAAAHPEDLRARAWLGRALAQRGDLDLALPHLRAAWEAGLRSSEPALALASRMGGDLDTYLRLVGSSPPLPVDLLGKDGALSAYREALGLVSEQHSVVVQTSLGPLQCELFWRQAPLTVGAFLGLARGGTPWMDEQGVLRSDPLTVGTTFHRVIPGFMVQGGDPRGDGSGGPGWAFMDETHPDLRFDRPGRLAMANSGPATNGSQWFITEVPTPHLDGKHTIFGQCDEASMEVVRAMGRVPRGAADKPVNPIRIDAVELR